MAPRSSRQEEGDEQKDNVCRMDAHRANKISHARSGTGEPHRIQRIGSIVERYLFPGGDRRLGVVFVTCLFARWVLLAVK